jgi:hypothetical protein
MTGGKTGGLGISGGTVVLGGGAGTGGAGFSIRTAQPDRKKRTRMKKEILLNMFSQLQNQGDFIAEIWILGTPEAIGPDFLGKRGALDLPETKLSEELLLVG